jgi:hypothetical protein
MSQSEVLLTLRNGVWILGKAGLSEEVRKFIVEHIDSIGQLEVLLFLYRNKESLWTAELVGDRMRSSAIAADQQLKGLHSHQLVTLKVESGRELYGFNSSFHSLDSVTGQSNDSDRKQTSQFDSSNVVGEVARFYETHRVAVITLIYEKPVDAIRSFANAFRLKKDG